MLPLVEACKSELSMTTGIKTVTPGSIQCQFDRTIEGRFG